jgi:hypothetical protein
VAGQVVEVLDNIVAAAWRSAQTAGPGHLAALLRTATLALREKLNVLTQIGLLNQAVTRVAVVQRSEIPTGAELAELFRNASISENDIMSPAERALRYGEYPSVPASSDRTGRCSSSTPDGTRER